ncbi:sigma-70 family RNA polymerase sigma factor [Betaproteobacteria bacterium PRO7]|nr:sigma-70 family RNA polymerase sigma factor [Betaproteobacteria bacterium PRO7]GIL05008.1 MAG: DNA-directed RNA polymerase sigma-70 factor [Betaproteobacteria bacterium]
MPRPDPRALTDGECAAVAQGGDRDAFGELVRRYQDRLYRYVLRLVGQPDEAVELVQEAFVRAWQALPQWRPEAQWQTWLYRIASNVALDALRRRRIVEFAPLEEDFDAASDEPDPQRRLELKQELEALAAGLAKLSHEHREILLLREQENMSYEEIGTVLGLSEGTVKSRLARARAALIESFPGRAR